MLPFYAGPFFPLHLQPAVPRPPVGFVPGRALVPENVFVLTRSAPPLLAVTPFPPPGLTGPPGPFFRLPRPKPRL